MVISGFYLGMAVDSFRRFTPYWKNRIVLTYVMEISFWLTQTVILFYVLFKVNSGEIRFYVFIACLLGFSMYQVFAAKVYKRVLEIIIRTIASIYQFIKHVVNVLLIRPIVWVITVLLTICLGIIRIVWKVVQFILKLLLTPIGWIFKAIYSILPVNFQNFLKKIAGFYSKIENILIKWLKRSIKK